ncbi:DUF4426 domain-containing protein [Pseudoxanthomonas wuyuanensis]|nr:DUF4426 domain-containing protein [Pseudoxanthomonas wuyuanensis]
MTENLSMRRYCLPLLCLLALAACSGGESPRAAEFVAPVPAESDFGDLRVRYNALPTMALSEAVAKQYGVERDPGTALVVIALRRVRGGEETDTDGEVALQASDLSGARQNIALRVIDIGDYSDHIGIARVSPRNSYRFEVAVDSGGRKETLQFQRNF